MVLTGEITFIISLVNVVYVNPNENLDIDCIWLVNIANKHMHIYDHFLHPIGSSNLSFISGYEVREKALDTYYCNIYLKSDKILSLRLSESSYLKLEHYC